MSSKIEVLAWGIVLITLMLCTLISALSRRGPVPPPKFTYQPPTRFEIQNKHKGGTP